jgi:uncharacterized protein
MDPYVIILISAAAVGWAVFARRLLRAALSVPERFPAVHWRWPEALFAACVVLFFLSTGASAFGKEPQQVTLDTLEMSAALYAAVSLFLIGFLVMRNVNLIDAFGLGGDRAKSMIKPVFFAILVAIPPIYGVQGWVYSSFADANAPQPIVTFLLEHRGLRERVAVVLIALIAAPVTEELVFRGCLYGMLREFCGRGIAIVVSALVFALIHGHAASLPGLLILAVALAFLYEATGTLWAPLAMHTAFNGLSLLGTLCWPEVVQ